MSARAIALGDKVAYLAPDPANYVRTEVSAQAYNDPLHTLNRAGQLLAPHRSGVLLIKAGKELATHWTGQREPLADAGWTCTAVEPWTTWKHPDRPTVHVGLIGAIDYTRTPLFGPGDFPADVVRRLAWAELAIGAPWHMTAGVTGHAAIREHYAQIRRIDRRRRGGATINDAYSEPYWGTKDKREPGDRRNGSGDLIWRRRPLRSDVAMGWVHAYDLNAARLAAMGVAELAWGKLRRVDRPAFDPASAGYWLVHVQDVAEPFRGAIYDPADVAEGTVWLTTPTMQALSNLGLLPEPIEAWLATARRALRAIAEKWNGSRAQAPPGPALNTIKAVYREAAGLFARDGGSIVRPDWYHTIMDRQRVTVLSHILRVKRTAGLLPLAVHTDCLWYPSDDDSADRTAERLGLRLGTSLGTFRVHSTAPADTFFKKR